MFPNRFKHYLRCKDTSTDTTDRESYKVCGDTRGQHDVGNVLCYRKHVINQQEQPMYTKAIQGHSDGFLLASRLAERLRNGALPRREQTATRTASNSADGYLED